MRLLQYEGEKNHFQDVRMVEINGKTWFVASDVARVLWYEDTSDAIRRHCDPDGTVKHRLVLEKRRQTYLLIDEPNIYRLSAKSKLPWAKKFEKWVYEEVLPQIRKQWFYGKIDRSIFPNFIQRFVANIHNIPRTYFSVIGELFITVYGELEKVGYQIPDRAQDGKQMMPDISVGLVFSRFLKEKYPEWYETREKYMHIFPNGKEQEAYMYPLAALPVFREFVFNIWFPEYADQYFAKRDPLATNYIPMILWLEDSKKPTPRLKAVKQAVKKTK